MSGHRTELLYYLFTMNVEKLVPDLEVAFLHLTGAFLEDVPNYFPTHSLHKVTSYIIVFVIYSYIVSLFTL